MIHYPTFSIPKFFDIHLSVFVIGIIALIAFTMLYFIYAHNVVSVVSSRTGKKIVLKRPSDALPAISLTVSIVGIFAIMALYIIAPLYNDNLMTTKIEKDYDVNVLMLTKKHDVTITTHAGSTYLCSISSKDQIKYAVMCPVQGGYIPLNQIVKPTTK